LSDIVIDTSAAVAVLTGEGVGGDVINAIESSDRVLMSAASLVELGIVLEARLGPVGAAVIERFLRAGSIEVVAVNREIADAAMGGWRRFGKGRNPAGLNFGDCFVYGLAATTGAAVLCVGDDFARTDLETVDRI
jgi:ribonuclease VapC